MPKFVIGVSELDKLLPEALYPGALVVIAGHPGAGKTTLATAMCYANALRGNKCLYISFQESRDKLFKVMKALGMDLASTEARGLYKFVKLPIIKSVDDVIEIISKCVTEFKPKVVVVDSINAILEFVEEADQRAWLQNYFCQLAEMVEGMAVLIAELPRGEEKLRLGAIEFASDIMFVLHHRVVGGKLVRLIEIRKTRGAPVTAAEVPFQIVEGAGIKTFVPPVLKEIRAVAKPLKLSTSLFRSYIGEVLAGDSVLITYPPHARNPLPMLFVFDLAMSNGLKALVISYRYSPIGVKRVLASMLTDLGIKESGAREIIDEFMVVEALNPYGMSVEELYMKELELVNKYRPGIVVFHGVEVLEPIAKADMYRYYNLLSNQLYYLKSSGIVAVRNIAYISREQFRRCSSYADVVIRALYRVKGTELTQYLYMWRRGRQPKIIRVSDVQDQLRREIAELAEKLVKSKAR